MEISKRQAVKAILEVVSQIPNERIPKTKDNTIDMEKFNDLPETQAVLILFDLIKVDTEWLREKGFIAAEMLLGSAMYAKKHSSK